MVSESMSNRIRYLRIKTRMTGACFITETLKGYGVTHVFFFEAILRRGLVKMEAMGIQRILQPPG